MTTPANHAPLPLPPPPTLPLPPSPPLTPSPIPPEAGADRLLISILCVGVLVRLAVLISAQPFNPDRHAEVIQYIAERRALPDSHRFGQSFHPPLYHALMAPLWATTKSYKALHVANTLISVANLVLIWRLVRRHELFPTRAARIVALSIAALLPQFVMYGSFISNDTLTALVGTIVFTLLVAFVERPSALRMGMLAMSVGIGLLTKGTFVLTGVVLAPVVWVVQRRAAIVALFCLVWLVVGSYKFVENTVKFGRPVVHNLDADGEWSRAQRGTVRGWQSFIDVDVTKPIREPILNVRRPLSIPLLLYATFWYPHIPDSSFRASIRGYDWVGSATYAAATVPTLAFLAGVGCAGVATAGLVRGARDVRRIVLAASLMLLLSNASIVIAAGIRYDVWSCFQSRLCFQSMAPALVLLGAGLLCVRRVAVVRWIVDIACVLTIACCVVYFLVEIGVTFELLPAAPERVAVERGCNPCSAPSTG